MNNEDSGSSFEGFLRSLGMERKASEASLIYGRAENHEDLQFEFNLLLMSGAFSLVQVIYPHRISGIRNAFRRRFRPSVHRAYWQRVCALFCECANILVGYSRRIAAPHASRSQITEMFEQSVAHAAVFFTGTIRAHPIEKEIMEKAATATIILAEEFPALTESELLDRLSETIGSPLTGRQFLPFNFKTAQIVEMLDAKAYCARWCVLACHQPPIT